MEEFRYRWEGKWARTLRQTQSKANWKDDPEGRRDGFSIDRMMVTSPSSPPSPSGHSFYKLGLWQFLELVKDLASQKISWIYCKVANYIHNLSKSRPYWNTLVDWELMNVGVEKDRLSINSRRLTYGGSGMVSPQIGAITQPHASLSQTLLSFKAVTPYDVTMGIPRVQPMCLLLESLLWVIQSLPFSAAAFVPCSDSQCSRKLLYDSFRIGLDHLL